MTFPMDPTLRPGQMGPASSGVVQRVLDSGAARVTNINETTRNGIAQLVAEGVRQGMSPAELGDVIERWSGWDEYRAELIARTELGTAYNEASLGAYADSGVTEVHITDGDGDDECAPWDDVTVPIDEAPEPLGHPNCTRDFEPVVTWTAQDAADFATEFGTAPDLVDAPLQAAQDALTAGETTLPEPLAAPDVAAAEAPAPVDLGADRAAQNAWQSEHYGSAWKDALTPGQVGTLEDYTGEQGYAYVNSYLRGFYEPKPENTAYFGPKMSREALDNYVGRMDAALEVQPLPSDMVLYRSLSIDWEEETSPISTLFGNSPSSMLVGRSGVDPGFVSTSLRADISSIIEGEYRMELTVPAGTPAAGLAGITAHPGESEVLLGRNLRFTITGVHEDGKITVIEATVSR